MYSMQDGPRHHDFSSMYSSQDGRGDSYPGRLTMQDDRRDSFPPRHAMHDDRRDSFPPRHERRDSFGPSSHIMEGGRGDDFSLRQISLRDGRRDEFSTSYRTQDGRGDDFSGSHSMHDGRRDSFSRGNKGVTLKEAAPAAGWTSSIVNPISSLVSSFWSRESDPRTGVGSGLSMEGPPTYYSGQDSNYPSQSYRGVSMDYESRDLNGSHSGKVDSTLAIYGSRDIMSSPLRKGDSTLAVYDPQLAAARKEIKDLESVLAEKESLIENLESILREKKKFIDHMEKDFRDVTKSAFLKEMRVKDLEAKEGAYQMKMKEKEQELRGFLYRLEKAQSDSAMKDAKIKELQSFLEAARTENQQLKALKSQEEEKRRLDLVTVEQLNTKLSELTIASGQSESKKLQLTNQVKELMKRNQDLKQQTSAQEAKLGAKDLELQSVRDQLREEKEKSSKLVEELEQKHMQMEDLIQFVEELEEQSKALQAQVSTTDTSAQTDGQEQLKAQCAALEEQVESHELVTQNLRARLREEWETTSKLSEKLQQCDLQIDDLKHQLQEFKTSQNGEISKEIIGKGPSLGPQATPHLLDRAVQRVHEGAGIFSRLLMKAMEQGKIDGMAVARNNFVRSVSLDRGAPLKYVLEAITCKLLFHGFEHECFDLQDSTSGFLDVEQQRMDNFRQYKYLSSMENTEQLVHAGDSLFADFCRIKLEDLSDTIPEIANMVNEITELTFDRPPSPVESDSEVTAKLGATFVQLAVCVWQVHKLAFSFNPVARIFRVSQSEKFVEKYMESVIFQESESDDDEHLSSSDISRVDFMVVPGFLINKYVVRSRVFVVTKTLTNNISLTVDPNFAKLM